MADPGTVQSFCDHIGIEPVSAALRAIDRHNTEHVWLVLQDGRRVYYHTEAALLSLDLLPGYVLRAVGVGGIAWEGSDWEWARECPPDPGWKGLDRLREEFHEALEEHWAYQEVEDAAVNCGEGRPGPDYLPDADLDAD